MSFKNDSPSKLMHFCPRQVTPNQFKLIQGGDPEHFKSGQGLASLPPITYVHFHHHHHWKNWFLEDLFTDCRTPVAFVSRNLVLERLISLLSKDKKTRGPTLAPTAHETVNFSKNLKQALKYHVINSISCSSALFSSYQVFPKLLNPSCLEVGQFCSKTNKILTHLCYCISWSKHLGTYLKFPRKGGGGGAGGGIYWKEGA